ncbi:MAG: hypothetical protein ACUVQ1_06980 [Candidatus Kapaibacteriales bacterium]
MKRLFILLSFFTFSANLFSQSPIRFNISLIGNDTINFNKLVFGFDSSATNGIDTNLGEIELPPIIPPSGVGVYGVFVFYDSSALSNVWSYYDIRPFPKSYLDTIKFLIFVFRDFGIKLKFYWPSVGDEFNSAWLVDEYLGTLANANMKQQNSLLIENDFLDRFYIKVTLPIFSKVSDNPKDIFKIETNSQFIQITNIYSSKYFYEIIDIFGKIVVKGESSDEILFLPLSQMGKGLFIVTIHDVNGNRSVCKIMSY